MPSEALPNPISFLFPRGNHGPNISLPVGGYELELQILLYRGSAMFHVCMFYTRDIFLILCNLQNGVLEMHHY
jgi:hypothetical protein